ncbi:L-Aspartase-like protein [Obelidium mucronatum]|nr:L-Aspartase-like protein [Obelidium mucronatum]
MLGLGKVWNPKTNQFEEALKVLKEHNIEPVVLGPKEGLALINGTQFITSLGSEAVVRAENACKVADIVTAMTLEVLKGTIKPMDPKIHLARPHTGQIKVANRIRTLLTSETKDGSRSELGLSHANCKKVQDFIHSPMHPTKSISGGNFHGEYPAKALDYLAIGIHELASISERRIERLVNPQLSAALVSENKVLCHPASVDSISTSAAQEDHVSMGGFSARKALEVVENVEKVLAIELLCACQALDLLRPLKTVGVLEKAHSYLRNELGIGFMNPDIEAAWEFITSGKLVEIVEEVWN